jgi:hypothetical protein
LADGFFVGEFRIDEPADNVASEKRAVSEKRSKVPLRSAREDEQ